MGHMSANDSYCMLEQSYVHKIAELMVASSFVDSVMKCLQTGTVKYGRRTNWRCMPGLVVMTLLRMYE